MLPGPWLPMSAIWFSFYMPYEWTCPNLWLFYFFWLYNFQIHGFVPASSTEPLTHSLLCICLCISGSTWLLSLTSSPLLKSQPVPPWLTCGGKIWELMSLVNISLSDSIIFHNWAVKKQKTKNNLNDSVSAVCQAPVLKQVRSYSIKSGRPTNQLKINELTKHVTTSCRLLPIPPPLPGNF